MEFQLFVHQLYVAFLKRSGISNNKKSYETWLKKGYTNTPLISFIIQSHNKGAEVKHIVSKLRKYPNAEIIVIDDGSRLNHTQMLTKFLVRGNEFLIRANDLYEVVMYDKAIRFANGAYIALLQDDDDFDSFDWIDQALNYFDTYPRLAILGGFGGLDFTLDEEKKRGETPPLAEIEGNKDFMFVHHVNRAPMWLSKHLFMEKLRHLDISFAPFQLDDCEICLRAWLNGLQVGWYKAGFTSLSSGGMRIWNTSFTGEQWQRNAKTLYELYKDKKETIDKLVRESRETTTRNQR